MARDFDGQRLDTDIFFPDLCFACGHSEANCICATTCHHDMPAEVCSECTPCNCVECILDDLRRYAADVKQSLRFNWLFLVYCWHDEDGRMWMPDNEEFWSRMREVETSNPYRQVVSDGYSNV